VDGVDEVDEVDEVDGVTGRRCERAKGGREVFKRNHSFRALRMAGPRGGMSILLMTGASGQRAKPELDLVD